MQVVGDCRGDDNAIAGVVVWNINGWRERSNLCGDGDHIQIVVINSFFKPQSPNLFQ